MIISIWRYSHLALAILSVVFVLTLSVTGVILAFEPIAHGLENQRSAKDFPEITVGQTIEKLNEKYPEIIDLSVDANGFISLSAITENGDISDFYIDPLTGKNTGAVAPQSELMMWATSVHRSLFLKSTGRIIVGLSSFLLFLIVVSGIILIIKRQQGIRNFFSKIVNENFTQYAHVYLGRLALIPLFLITLTGVYLSLLRFSIIPAPIAEHQIDYDNIDTEPKVDLADFPIFKNTSLSEIRSVEFPFSDDPYDFYKISLSQREVVVNQITGEVLSENIYPMIVLMSGWATVIHTGRGSILWSVILALSSLAILFFIYSGFRMTFRRRSSRIRNRFRKNECKYIILVGSETGTTMGFARIFHQQLTNIGVKSYITQMNDVGPFREMENLVVFTATYGIGEPPANARKFAKRIREIDFQKPFNYAVVGFGSLAYADFCKFAFETETILSSVHKTTRLMDTFTINSRSHESFKRWVEQWGSRAGVPVSIPNGSTSKPKLKPKKKFEVIRKNAIDDTFTIELKPLQKTKIKSGGLLAVYPENDVHERLYSVGVLRDGRILLGIKRHEKGKCSNYLNELIPGNQLEGRVVKNKDFHFPAKAKNVILISSGTGVAPFLGMLSQNLGRIPTRLYWGGKTKYSFGLYKNPVSEFLNDGRLTEFQPAYSREESSKNYVQNLILRDSDFIAQTLQNKGIIMICGSIAMQKGVTETLQDICMKMNTKPLSYYQRKGQVKMDCY